MKFFSIIPLLITAVIAAPAAEPGYPSKFNGKGISWSSATTEAESRWPSDKTDANCIFWTGGGVTDANIATLKQKLSDNGVSWRDVFSMDLVGQWNWGLGDSNAYYTIQMTSFVFAEQCKGDTAYLFIPSGASVDDPFGENKPTTWVSYEYPALTINANVKTIRRVDPDDIDGTWSDDSKIFWQTGDTIQTVTFPTTADGVTTD